jgi:hypothetical protein
LIIACTNMTNYTLRLILSSLLFTVSNLNLISLSMKSKDYNHEFVQVKKNKTFNKIKALELYGER